MNELRPHPDKQRMDALMPAVREFQALAGKHGIGDIFQDNGGKLLQLVLTMDLIVSAGRSGSDAKDRLGREYELKSVEHRSDRIFQHQPPPQSDHHCEIPEDRMALCHVPRHRVDGDL